MRPRRVCGRVKSCNRSRLWLVLCFWQTQTTTGTAQKPARERHRGSRSGGMKKIEPRDLGGKLAKRAPAHLARAKLWDNKILKNLPNSNNWPKLMFFSPLFDNRERDLCSTPMVATQAKQWIFFDTGMHDWKSSNNRVE